MRVSSQNGLSVKEAWLILAILYIVLFIFSATLFLLFITPAPQPGLWSYLPACAVIIVYMLTAQSENFQISTRARLQPSVAVLAIIMGLAMFVLRDILLKLLPVPSFLAVSFATVQADNVLSIMGSALLLPVLEEVLFRGIVLNGLVKKHPPAYALLQSSLIYAVATLNPAYMLPKFLLGLLCGLFYLRTHRGLYASILIHLVYNIGVVSLLAFGQHGLAEAVDSEFLYFVLVVTACMLLPPGYYLLQRVYEKMAGR
ncbi:CPBP family glutamic-type intramembrane protease [Chitinophaga sedimenti]|uniref:CPBP family glutamic-type intramembrane protease n=1 Tax=Chitinophaga sedimenti TaxID=2033606 RepID=UPI0020056E8E|nr:CPBP family glutamic-type intramembrane protease [Chitinophaga sedimenti]MCK7558856.1 CPBP family glutamic-type intramembrane protease [Chitinophaga sedimenti]